MRRGLLCAVFALTSLEVLGCGARSEMLLDLPPEAGAGGDGVPDERAPDASAPDSCDLPSAAPDIAELALGEETSCALLHDGTVWCWV